MKEVNCPKPKQTAPVMSTNISLVKVSLLAKANIHEVGAYALPAVILQSHMVKGRMYNFVTKREGRNGNNCLISHHCLHGTIVRNTLAVSVKFLVQCPAQSKHAVNISSHQC